MKKFSWTLALLMFLLISCTTTTEPIIPDSPIIPEEPKEYQKDEEGFYILEDSYFSNTSKKDGLKASKLRYATTVPRDEQYSQMRLYAANQQIPLYNTKVNVSQIWNALAPQRTNSAVAVVELEGVMTFKLQCNFLIREECKISPLNAKVDYTIDEDRRVVTFTIKNPGQYTIEFRSKRTLHLFVNEYRQYDAYRENENIIYFGPGIHNSKTSKYISSDNYIQVKSNQTIFLDLGAIVEGGFKASNASNFKIVGSGVVTGKGFERNAETGARFIPYDFSFCNNFTIEGITTLDPAGWCYNIYFCKNVWIDNIKIISSRSNGDGISLQSCQDVQCKNSFVRSWDDSLVVKNYPIHSTSQQGTTKNIEFYNCILWTDLAQSMEIGFETIGKVMENITFDTIVVIHNYHKAPISIHNGNNADIKNIKFLNITIEDASMGLGDGTKVIVDFSTEFSATWSTNHMTTELGSIDEVLLKNILVLKGIKAPKISLRGCIDKRDGYHNSLHKITNVIFEDVYLYDNYVDANYVPLDTQYCEAITFSNTGQKPTGAKWIETQDVSLYGSEYYIECYNE